MDQHFYVLNFVAKSVRIVYQVCCKICTQIGWICNEYHKMNYHYNVLAYESRDCIYYYISIMNSKIWRRYYEFMYLEYKFQICE